MKAVDFTFAIRSLKSEIPNITGIICHGVTDGYINGNNGFISITLYSHNNRAQGGAGFRVENWNFDASRASNRYGNYTEVNPLYNSVLMLIRY